MASPCPRCGATKTESVKHGLIYEAFWRMGYHLRRCSFCNRKRLFKRAHPERPHPDDMTAQELQELFDRKIAESLGKPYVSLETHGGRMDSNSSEETNGVGVQTGGRSVGVAEASEEVVDYHLCPKCGSTIYRRSRRRWWERLIRRPRMARCLKCDHRFPYPH
jgi:hypothetical protein